jgi:UDP-N-acetylmuramoylalanine--D-glutamate ligase
MKPESGHEGDARPGCQDVEGKGVPESMRRILVVGASRSGVAAARALASLGRDTLLSDRNQRELLKGIEEAERAGARLLHTPQDDSQLEGVDLLIKSPGVPAESDLVRAAVQRGVPVWSEVELAYRLLPNPFSAVTGTNGKTTTTALLGHMFETAGRPARVLGNIGRAVTSVVGEAAPIEELVVEVSSFQLEDVHCFRPAAGVLLNLSQDHLDRHGTMERYLECKARLFARQGPDDVAVLNAADPAVVGLSQDLAARASGPRVLLFSTEGPDGAASWLTQGCLFLLGEPVARVEEVALRGLHNMENCLAAGTAALARGLDPGAVREALLTFPGVAHRLQRAGIVAGIAYVNDSKATNVEAALKALAAYPQGTHLILGGRDKNSDYRPLARACARGCRAVYLVGEATPLIAEAFAEVRAEVHGGSVPVPLECGDLERAVAVATSKASVGDVVLLAPACASFDQYRDFEKRGEHFMEIVSRLQTASGSRKGSAG